MSLTDFLLARIAEDEAARDDQLTIYAWSGEPGGTVNMDWEPSGIGGAVAEIGPIPGKRTGGLIRVRRHDPARVLAECETKRRLVEWHGSKHVCDDSLFMPENWDEGNPPHEPCEVLKILGSVHAEHPDYREEWKPYAG